MLDLQAATRLMGKSGGVGREWMADDDEPVQPPDEAMDRIDAALDRIAARRLSAAAFSPNAAAAGTVDSGVMAGDTAVIAARLDGLITRLREALAIAAG